MRFANFAALALLGVATHRSEHAERSVVFRDRINTLTALPGEQVHLAAFERRWTWTAPRAPGLYPLHVVSGAGDSLTIHAFVLVPYRHVRREYLNGYRIGRYPALAAPPAGFVEVTKANENVRVSPHFRLKQFVCKQAGGYPKYVVLNANLLQRLEQLLALTNESGYRASTFHVMSGFRTPAYNRALGNVANSRHLWGAAADVFIDEDRDGRMDDLNGDGISDERDADVLYRLFEEPQRAGGLGKYAATDAHGPFVHIDVRGRRARW